MFKYLKKNWLGSLGLLIGIIGLFLSSYFYSLSIKSREPVFVTLSNVAIFSSPTKLSSKYIKLIKRTDGKELSKNLYVQEIVLWNNGREAIKESHILKPLNVSFNGEMEIIDAFITEMKRPEIVKGKIKFKPGEKDMMLEFDILEKNDGLKIQIVYSALKSHEAILKGTIEGVPKIKRIEDLTKENILLAIAQSLLYGIGLIALFIFTVTMPLVFGWLNKKIFGKYHEKANNILGNVFGAIFLLIIFAGLSLFIYLKVREFSEASAIESVPKMYKINQVNDQQ